MTTQADFLQANAPDGMMTPQQAAQFLELAEGDTGTMPDSGTPDAAPVDDVPVQTGAAPASGNEPDPEKSVILAKDGVHTIPFSKLAEARESERQWRAQAEAQALELQTLKAEAQARADAGQAPTQTDNAVAAAVAAIESGIDPEIVFGDFSPHEMVAGIDKVVAYKVEKLLAPMREQIAKTVEPLQAKQQVDATEAHYAAIRGAHPDADSIAQSVELANWIAGQPSFARAGYEAVLAQGSTEQIIEFFDTFKAATGQAKAAPVAQPDPKAAARAALAKLGAVTPNSLSDIPGGTAGPTSRFEAMSRMSGIELVNAMDEMTPAQVDAFLSRKQK